MREAIPSPGALATGAGSFGLPQFLAVMVDRQQQTNNDGDCQGLSADLLGREAQVITCGVSRRECSRDRGGHRQKNSQHSANGRFHRANMRLRQAGSSRYSRQIKLAQ
jgi:hypothetical protein